MKIKKVIAQNMPDAMKKIKEELGPDAVILNSKEISSGGIFGLFTKRNVEVIAAIDPAPPKLANDTARENPDREMKGTTQSNTEAFTLKPQMTNEINSHSENYEIRSHSGNGIEIPKLIDQVLQRLYDQEMDDKYIQFLQKNLIKEWYKHEESLSIEELKQILYKMLLDKSVGFSLGTEEHKL